jgi:hypothetical protein
MMNGSALSYIALALLALTILFLSGSSTNEGPDNMYFKMNDQREEFNFKDDHYLKEMTMDSKANKQDINFTKLLDAIEEVKDEIRMNRMLQGYKDNCTEWEPNEGFNHTQKQGE